MNFLPGWSAPLMRPNARLKAVTFVVSATVLGEFSSSSDITAPNEIEPGDLLVLLDRAVAFPTPANAIPAGFVQVSTLGGGIVRQTVSYKVADGTEAGATLTGMGTSLNGSKTIAVFRGNKKIRSASINSVNAQLTDAKPADQTITAGSGSPPLIAIAAFGSSGNISSGIMTPTQDGYIGSSSLARMAYKGFSREEAGVDIVVSMNDAGDRNVMQSWYFSFT